jgi:hypothetical protein
VNKSCGASKKIKKKMMMMMMTYSWLLPALYSSHHMYQNKNKRDLWARPTSSERKICDSFELLVDFENFLCRIGPAVTEKKTNFFFYLCVR